MKFTDGLSIALGRGEWKLLGMEIEVVRVRETMCFVSNEV